ncbi:MAG: prolipoprotein diacylglyceryl transferase [Deltaproteobacteria bacterium]|nr:prolipoprotein diacylglyceryl transferase [Deltaproteobacteria bacterium]MBI3294713.1 prolipoprotein diacylglyceryl transferase [Deltaproteobacteria bacterium]
MAHLHQPEIDPVLIKLWGPFQIRWYSLLYVGAFVVARFIMARLSREDRFKFSAEDVEQFIVWGLVGAVIGARIIYCFVYDPEGLAQNPLYLFQVYKGGLSFHGGLLGTIVAAFLFSRKRGIPFWNLTDAMALATPSGLAMGRLGNFVNGELFGRVSDVPWAMIFRDGGPSPRHPSQLYEFFLEGVVLFLVLWFARQRFSRDGQISLLFLVGYSMARIIVEFFREPDVQVGYLTLGLTMGQILSLITIAAAVVTWKFAFGRVQASRKRRY